MGVSAGAIGDTILGVALRFERLIETAPNCAWDDAAPPEPDAAAAELRQLLVACGWQAGWPYCAAFVEAVWRTAYTELGAPAALLAELAAKFTPSVLQSYAHWGPAITRVPVPGAIVFWQHAHGPHGHAGLVIRATASRLTTLEVTPPGAQAPEGIYRRTRRLDFTPSPTGLWLRGFLAPRTWDEATTAPAVATVPAASGLGAV
jgi:hypothetical protein